jgi:hypothetical protein
MLLAVHIPFYFAGGAFFKSAQSVRPVPHASASGYSRGGDVLAKQVTDGLDKVGEAGTPATELMPVLHGAYIFLGGAKYLIDILLATLLA